MGRLPDARTPPRAARRVLERDGSAFVLRPWQAGYLIALAARPRSGVPCRSRAGWVPGGSRTGSRSVQDAGPGLPRQTRSTAIATEPPPPRHSVARP